MIYNCKSLGALLSFAMVLLLNAPNAFAGLDQCGGVFIFAEAACEFQPTEECKTTCTTVAVQDSCAAQIYPDCESSCSASATAECETGCNDACVDDCNPTDAGTASEQPKNCMGMCMSDCQQDCTGSCADAQKTGPCRSCCAHNCGDKCEAQCADEPEAEAVECEPTCETACTGSCTAKASVQCQIDCQTAVYAKCEQELVERCETECETTGGVIFCNGQFVNASDLNDCSEQLATEVNIEIDVKVEVVAEVDITTSNDDDDGDSSGDELEDGIDAACSVGGTGSRGHGHSALGLFSLFGLGTLWRIKRRSSSRTAVQRVVR